MILETFDALTEMEEFSLSGELEKLEDNVDESSTTDGTELFLPKLNFHLEDFFAMVETGVTGAGAGMDGLGAGFGGLTRDFEFVSTMGTGNMETGS